MGSRWEMVEDESVPQGCLDSASIRQLTSQSCILILLSFKASSKFKQSDKSSLQYGEPQEIKRNKHDVWNANGGGSEFSPCNSMIVSVPPRVNSSDRL